MCFQLFNEVSEEVDDWIWNGQFEQAIQHCEAQLRERPLTSFHAVLESDWTGSRNGAVDWLVEFFARAQSEIQLRSVECQLLPITPMFSDWEQGKKRPLRWRFDGFGYERVGNSDGLDWLNGSRDFTLSLDEDCTFELPGMDALKETFRTEFHGERPTVVRESAELTLLLVILRAYQLMHGATLNARETARIPAAVTVALTSNDWDPACVIVGVT